MRWIACLPVLILILPAARQDDVDSTAASPVTSSPAASQPVEIPTVIPGLTVVDINAAILRVVDAVAPSAVVIEVDRRPASVAPGTPLADSRWISFGAGVILHADGRILTCQHLIDGAAEISVILHDGRRLSAQRIAEDRRSDLAVIRANVPGLASARIGASEALRAGSLVLSFGNPLGLASDGQAAVTFGIVSAIDRPLPAEFGSDLDRFYGEMIQSSIIAGPGSSGGPLVSLAGDVVGIVAAVPSRGGNLSPISFAIPMTERNRRIVRDLSEGRSIEHGYLGVEVDVPSQAERESVKLDRRIGVRIAAVFADGPADRAGLRAGDIITAIQGKPIRSVDGFVSLIGSHMAGERTSFEVIRDERIMPIVATLTKRPDVPDQPLPELTLSFRGAALAHVDPAMRSVANLPEHAMLVRRVETDSPAHRAGLVPGDVIIRADGRTMQPDVARQLLSIPGDVMLGLASGASVVVKP